MVRTGPVAQRSWECYGVAAAGGAPTGYSVGIHSMRVSFGVEVESTEVPVVDVAPDTRICSCVLDELNSVVPEFTSELAPALTTTVVSEVAPVRLADVTCPVLLTEP